MLQPKTDPFANIYIINSNPNPQRTIWLAAHQDYSADPVAFANVQGDEEYFGKRVIQMLLAGGRGHFGCLEHGSVTLNAVHYPHSVMQQVRTHRVGITFDVQSFRYTSQRLMKVRNAFDLESVVYFRPVGKYSDRSGTKYYYSVEQRNEDILLGLTNVFRYQQRVQEGCSEEHIRGLINFDYRQHFVFTVNPRSLMHLLDLRHKPDAQLECQWWAADLFHCFQEYCPQLADWYAKERLNKGKLSP